jgi:hypothetical protein
MVKGTSSRASWPAFDGGKEAKVTFTVKSLLSDRYHDELSDKPRRGLEGPALAGFSTGGCYRPAIAAYRNATNEIASSGIESKSMRTPLWSSYSPAFTGRPRRHTARDQPHRSPLYIAIDSKHRRIRTPEPLTE